MARQPISDEVAGGLLLGAAILGAVAAIWAGSWTLSKVFPLWERSKGVRVGTIQKFSDSKGWFCKSGEGELVQLGFKTRTQTTDVGVAHNQTNVWSFSATDPEVVKALTYAAETGEAVSLSYVQYAFVGPCSTDTHYVITKVKGGAASAR